MVPDDWITKAFTKVLNPKSLVTSFKHKENLIEFEATIQAMCKNSISQKFRAEMATSELLEGFADAE